MQKFYYNVNICLDLPDSLNWTFPPTLTYKVGGWTVHTLNERHQAYLGNEVLGTGMRVDGIITQNIWSLTALAFLSFDMFLPIYLFQVLDHPVSKYEQTFGAF